MTSRTLLEAIAVTAELTGTNMSEGAARVMAADLANYPEDQVLTALTRCRRELKGRLTIADVLTRIDDGRPGVEEAWAMIPRNESESVVWTAEMAQAFGVASRLIEEDPIAARMAFKEAYVVAVQRARERGITPRWTPSLGHDVLGRERAITEALEKGRLLPAHAQALLPNLQCSPEVLKQLGYDAKTKKFAHG